MIEKIMSKFISGSGILPEPEASKFLYYFSIYRRRNRFLNSIKYALASSLELSDECDCEDDDNSGKEETPHDRDISRRNRYCFRNDGR